MKSRPVAAAFAAAVISAAAYAGSVRVASECLWRPEGAAPSPLRAGARSAPLKAAPRAARSDAQWGEWALRAAEALKDRLGVSAAADELKVRAVNVDAAGCAHVRLSQVYRGIDVRAKELAVHFRPDGTAFQVNGAFLPGISVGTKPSAPRPKDATLSVWTPSGAADGKDARLAWRAPSGDWWRYTDATSGEVLGRERRRRRAAAKTGEDWLLETMMTLAPQARTNALPSGAACTIRGVLPKSLWTNDAPCTVEVPGIRGDDGRFYLCGTNSHGRSYAIWNMSGVRDAYAALPDRAAPLPDVDEANMIASFESADWGDYHPEAIAAAYNVTTVMDYFEECFARATYLGENATDARTCAFVCMPETDGSGRILGGYDNAFFYADVDAGSRSSEPDHSGAMYFGYYGDGVRTLQVLDITAHEFSHSIAGSTAQFVYEGESGALDESFADIFGVGCEMFAQGDGPEYPAHATRRADWFIGEDTGEVNPLRDVVHPASDLVSSRQAASYRDSHWADTFAVYIGDSGGVHDNSGIQNRFFYLLQSEIGPAAALQIAYLTVTGYCTPETDFHEVALLWKDAASQLAGGKVNGVDIPANAPEAVERCWAPLLERPAFVPEAGRRYVGMVEDLGLAYVTVSLGKPTSGATPVTVQFEIEDIVISAGTSLKNGRTSATFSSDYGTFSLDFAGDNVIGSWTVSRMLLDNSMPSLTVRFTAFHRAPRFWRELEDGGIPGHFAGERVDMILLAQMDFCFGDALLFSAQGLPAGISINSRTGEISGIVRGEQSGTAVITVKSKETGFSDTCSLAYDFAAQPEWSVGKYAAHVIDDASGETAGDIQLSSASSGAISGRIKAGKKTWSFTARGFDAEEESDTSLGLRFARNSGKDNIDTLLISVSADGISGIATISGTPYSFSGKGAVDLSLDAESIAENIYIVQPGMKLEIPVVVESDAPYTLSAQNLPQGLSLVKRGASYVISGTAKTPGERAGGAHLTVKTYALEKGKTFDVHILVDHYRSEAIPVEDRYDSPGTGVAGSLEIPGAAGCTARGLPSGLKFDAATGTISGVATKSGDFLVTFTRKVVSGKTTKTETATAFLHVEALPAWAVGTFDGASLSQDGETLAGLASLSVSAGGKVSGKLVCEDGTKLSFSIPSLGVDGEGRYTARGKAKSGKKAWDVEVVIERRDFASADGGTCGQGIASVAATPQGAESPSANATVAQNLWSSKEAKVPSFASVKGRKLVMAIPDVEGCDLSLSIAADGKTTAKARKSGSKKTVASASSQLVLRDYVPGEGWTCELPLSIPKAGIVQVLEFRIEDAY